MYTRIKIYIFLVSGWSNFGRGPGQNRILRVGEMDLEKGVFFWVKKCKKVEKSVKKWKNPFFVKIWSILAYKGAL